MAVRFKTDEELLATGWRRMTRDEVLNMTCAEELADEPCFIHPDIDCFFASSMRECGFKQEELVKLKESSKSSDFDAEKRLCDANDVIWTVSSMMLIEDSSAHTCVAVSVSLFFSTMACKTCGRSM